MGSEIVQIPQEEELAFKIPKGLEAVPRELWSSSGDDIGLLLSAELVIIKTKGGSPPSIKQYPIADEAIPSIQKQIAIFLEKGIFKECQSPYNTPILPQAIRLKIVCGILNICAFNLQKRVTVHLYPNCNSVNNRLERCNTLNPATLMPLPTDGEKDEHDCEQVIKMTSKPRDDLRDQPLDNPDMNLFTNGSSYYEEGWKCTGFAVTTETKVLLAGPLPPTLGAQGAEIVALTKAAQYAIGIRVNLYTDSKYAFGVCHATGMLWKERGFLTSAGKTIAHGQQIKELLEAIQLPSELAVIYIKAHTNQENQLAKGNELADQAAKAAARQVIFAMTLTHQGELDLELPDMQKLYEELPEEERRLWEKLGAERQNGQWTLGVRKSNGEWRLTVDYRGLNEVTPPMSAAVPDMLELQYELESKAAKWYATSDIANAFFSIPLAVECRPQFAFTWRGIQYTWNRLPQGWKHSPTICHGLIQAALGEKGEAPEHLQYIDDIIEWGNSAEEVSEKGKKIIQILLKAGFAIKPSKVKGPAQEIQFLGIRWHDGQRQIPMDIINKIAAMSPPTNKKETQAFLGVVGFWRMHIPNYSLIVRLSIA
ncbi:hypothetical protein GRJ2_003211200 [Grus japonensis]|uniref:ribonuclease H n=1 Tax=Grus japonensis TaxID=30415 RepID=A0ABC9YBK6_GRUJA